MNMTSFAQRLKKAMDDAKMNQADLSLKTGIGKPSISQYLSGKNEPQRKKIAVLADALRVSEEYLMGYDVPANTAPDFPVPKITTEAAARCMGKGDQFVREGLKRGILPFGSAIQLSSKWTYYISPAQFRDYVGVDRFNQFFGLLT